MDSKMKRRVQGLALVSVLTGTMALTTGSVAIAGEEAGQQPPNSQAKRIEGAWLLQVSRYDCQTGAAIQAFQSLVTFAQGGTLSNVTTGTNPALRTTGLGTWRRTGDHTFRAVTVVFLFDPAGVWTTTQRIANRLEIGSDPDELTGTTKVHFFDTNGNLISTGCATVLGRRLG